MDYCKRYDAFLAHVCSNFQKKLPKRATAALHFFKPPPLLARAGREEADVLPQKADDGRVILAHTEGRSHAKPALSAEANPPEAPSNFIKCRLPRRDFVSSSRFFLFPSRRSGERDVVGLTRQSRPRDLIKTTGFHTRSSINAHACTRTGGMACD
jgi:hypothetical protein